MRPLRLCFGRWRDLGVQAGNIREPHVVAAAGDRVREPDTSGPGAVIRAGPESNDAAAAQPVATADHAAVPYSAAAALTLPTAPDATMRFSSSPE